MNVLGLIFSLLLILSYGFYASWNQHTALLRLRSSYHAVQKANREILNSYESEIYNALREKPKQSTSHEPSEPKHVSQLDSSEPQVINMNRHCAKLNLWPLVQEGRNAHPLLYELAAKMIRTFYLSLLPKEKRVEYRFLDAFLASAKLAPQQNSPLCLEKLLIPNYEKPFYKMLKGTKKWDLASKFGYPSLLDYLKIEPSQDKLCLFHAHPDLITVLFNSQMANKLYSEVHKKDGSLLTQELLERLVSETHSIAIDPDLLKMLEFGRPQHKDQKKIFIAEDADVLLRKTISIKEMDV
jgi:hypothetical protein